MTANFPNFGPLNCKNEWWECGMVVASGIS